MSLSTLLLLTDSRLPAGGHAHSGGVEAAAAAGRVHDGASLSSFLTGRLHTVGLVAAAFAAAACRSAGDPALLSTLDSGLDARTPSPALRRASRSQGRALLRVGRAMFALGPVPAADPHHAVALGLIAGAAGLPPQQAALAAAYHSISGPASAAVRVLALDPYPVQALLAALAPACDAVAAAASSLAEAATSASGSVDDLPAAAAPLLDISAELHATWEVRLFAS